MRPTYAGEIAEVLINSDWDMNIKLSYGHREILIECPEGRKTNVAQLLKGLRNRHPDIYRHWSDKDGSIRPSIQVFVNGEHIRYLNGMETEIGEGDQIYVIPIITGG
jgi:molybdopterin converting factor small subunit